jgi:hypothetical protein
MPPAHRRHVRPAVIRCVEPVPGACGSLRLGRRWTPANKSFLCLARYGIAGTVSILAATPWHLRARGVRGTWAIRPPWLVFLGVALLLAAAVAAL